jgi:hypothetical protein
MLLMTALRRPTDRYGDDWPPYDGVPDATPETDPNHDVIGHEFMGGIEEKRWFCESHDGSGYWMYATDGSGLWSNVSERAIGRSFHLIHVEPDGLMYCSWGHVRPYLHGGQHQADRGRFDGHCWRSNCQRPLAGDNWHHPWLIGLVCGRCADAMRAGKGLSAARVTEPPPTTNEEIA